MQLKNGSLAEKRNATVDISELYIKYVQEYEHVFMEEIGESGVFIYRAIGRKEYRDIVTSEVLNECEKEEVICETCTLYPYKFDFSNCDEAGLPTVLTKKILENSLLTNPDALKNLIYHFRSELHEDYNRQVSCVIHEAFPEYEIDEIENWDIIKTAEFMSRAEFILHSLRGVPIAPIQTTPSEYSSKQKRSLIDTEEVTIDDAKNEFSNNINGTSSNPKNKPKLNQQSIRDLQAIAPEVDWSQDMGKFGLEGLKVKSEDTRRASEVPLDGSESGQNAIPEALRDRFKVIEK